MQPILPLVFDLTTPKGAALGWTPTAQDAFLDVDAYQRRFLLARYTPSALLLPMQEPTKPRQQAGSTPKALSDHYAHTAQTLVGQWHLGVSSVAGARRNALEETLLHLAFPLSNRGGEEETLYKNRLEIWQSSAALYGMSKTLPTLSLMRDYQHEAPDSLAIPYLPETLPAYAPDTPFVVCLAPELSPNASAHLRAHVLSDIHLHLRHLVSHKQANRRSGKPCPPEAVLAPVYAGRVLMAT